MRVNIFKNVKWATEPAVTELGKIVYMMQFSHELCARTEKYRQYLMWGRKKRAENMKVSLFPAFIPGAMMNGGKARKNVVGMTDLCFLDIDHIKNEKMILDALNKLRNDENVVMASRSISGDGLHILIRYRLKDAGLGKEEETKSPKEMQVLYGKVFDHLAVTYMLKLDLEMDMNAGHIEHMYIVSYDYELYYNPNAEPLMVDLNESLSCEAVEKYVFQINKRISEAEELITSNLMDDAEKMLLNCRQWILRLSCICNDERLQEPSSKIPNLNDYLEKISIVKAAVARATSLMDEVDEDLQNMNMKVAWEKIVESQHVLKGFPKPFASGLKEIRKRILENEMKLGALNRKIKYGYIQDSQEDPS